MQDQKILGMAQSGILPKVYGVPIYTNSVLAHTQLNVAVNIIIFQLSKSIPFFSFVLKRKDPRSVK
jgi:hypothetical protein